MASDEKKAEDVLAYQNILAALSDGKEYFGTAEINSIDCLPSESMKPTESLNLGRGFVLKNRTLLAAMTNKQSHEDGTLSSEEIDWLTRRAKGDFAITTTAAANVTGFGRGWEGEMGVWGDHQLPGLTKMATQLNSAGTVSLVQLFHGGMRAPRAINGTGRCH